MGRGESAWLWPVGVITALEIGAVFVVRHSTGYSDLPPFSSYAISALVLPLGAALLAFFVYLAWLFKQGEERPAARIFALIKRRRVRIATYFIGFQIVAASMAAFTGLKSMLTYASPFWADPLFADMDAAIFRTDPWRITHALLGPATPLIDRVYGLWIPFKFVTMLALLAAPASRLKTQALISQALMWALMGFVLAYVFSSAGPIYYQQVTGDPRFAEMIATLNAHPDLVAPRVASYLWADYASGHIAFGSGISAMPSMHVAIGIWTALILSRFGKAAAIAGIVYASFIFIGSVHLGWHYAVDGVLSGLGALLIWKLTGLYLDFLGAGQRGWREAHGVAGNA